MFYADIQSYSSIKGAPQSSSLIGILSQAVFQKNVDTAIFVIESIFRDEHVKFEHPSLLGVSTYPRGQITQGMWNAIIFSDENFESAWAMIQSTSFVDFIITGSNIYYIGKNKTDYVDSQLTKLIATINEGLLWKDSAKKIAFEIGQTTPYHFFYDQFKYLRYLCTSKIVYTNSKPIFYDPKVFDIKLSYSKPDDTVTFFPAVVTQNSCNALGYGGGDRTQKVRVPSKLSNNEVTAARVRECMESMELALLNDGKKGSTLSDPSKKLTLELWIGITSAKRAWLEQLEGYTNILENLAKTFNTVNVYVDGMTSAINSSNPTSKDIEIYNLLVSNLMSVENIKLISLIGFDYKSKIQKCLNIDAFITNGGTSSFVPLRVLKKPGVIHTNSKLMTFPDTYTDVTLITGKDENSTSNEDQAGTLSYSLNWQEILKALKSHLK